MNYNQVQSIDESGEVFVIKHLVKKFQNRKDLVFFDAGTNVGEYCKILKNQFEKSIIYSFEALPSTYEILLENVQTSKSIICINKALGSQKGDRSIYTDGAGSGLSSFLPNQFVTNKKLEKVTASITTIDSFCKDNNIKQIDFLKIDVEGFELEVLQGAEKMITDGNVLNIQFEFGGNHLTGRVHFCDLYQYLNKYKISRVLKNGLRTYLTYNTHQEIYLAANYLAELKEHHETK